MSQTQIDLFFTPLSKKPKQKKLQFNWILHDNNIVTTDSTPPEKKPTCSYHPYHNKNITITLYDQREEAPLFTDFEPLNSRMINLLKSNLQKCVRRRKVIEGIKTAYQLVKADPKEIFRRWPVICIEDAVCCTAFPALIWIATALHYEYNLKTTDLQLFLNSVASILKDDRCDDFSTEIPPSVLEINNFNTYPLIVQALLIRASLGGMKHDMNMLLNSAQLWLEKNNFEIHSTKHTEKLDPETIKSITDDDILPQSNDFHVSRKNLDLYNRGDYSDEEMIKAIWYHSSGVIFRTSIRDGSTRKASFEEGVKKTAECWNEINKF